MPYIKQHERDKPYVDSDNCGILNYQITSLIDGYIKLKSQDTKDKINYQIINDILGALEGAKLEFYRRVAVPYENRKLEENGDVYNVEVLS